MFLISLLMGLIVPQDLKPAADEVMNTTTISALGMVIKANTSEETEVCCANKKLGNSASSRVVRQPSNKGS